MGQLSPGRINNLNSVKNRNGSSVPVFCLHKPYVRIFCRFRPVNGDLPLCNLYTIFMPMLIPFSPF